MKQFGLLVFTLAIGAWLTGLVAAQENAGLRILRAGDELEAAFGGDVTTHLYAFDALAGDTVTLLMQQDTDDLDPFLILLSAAGEVLAADDDSGEAVLLSAAIVDYVIPEDGTYLVMATSFFFRDGFFEAGDIDALPYRIAIEGNTAPDSDEPFELFGSRIAYGETINGSVGMDESVFYLTFDGAAGDVVTLFIESDEFPTIMHLFDPAGNRIAVDPSAIVDLELPADGPYLLFATDIFFYEAVDFNTRAEENLAFMGGDFRLSLERAS